MAEASRLGPVEYSLLPIRTGIAKMMTRFQVEYNCCLFNQVTPGQLLCMPSRPDWVPDPVEYFLQIFSRVTPGCIFLFDRNEAIVLLKDESSLSANIVDRRIYRSTELLSFRYCKPLFHFYLHMYTIL